jgi:SapB morphogen precursor RamS
MAILDMQGMGSSAMGSGNMEDSNYSIVLCVGSTASYAFCLF